MKQILNFSFILVFLISSSCTRSVHKNFYKNYSQKVFAGDDIQAGSIITLDNNKKIKNITTLEVNITPKNIAVPTFKQNKKTEASFLTQITQNNVSLSDSLSYKYINEIQLEDCKIYIMELLKYSELIKRTKSKIFDASKDIDIKINDIYLITEVISAKKLRLISKNKSGNIGDISANYKSIFNISGAANIDLTKESELIYNSTEDLNIFYKAHKLKIKPGFSGEPEITLGDLVVIKK
jgi:hypothetical protein